MKVTRRPLYQTEPPRHNKHKSRGILKLIADYLMEGDVMEVRIYKIGAEANAKVKAILESEDMFDVKAKCDKCGQTLEGKIKASEYSQYLPAEKRGKGEPPKKKCKCGGIFKFERKELVKNEFARTGYIFRAAESLGLEEGNYLYVKADEEFFKKNEPILLQAGAKGAPEDEAAEVKRQLEAEEEAAAAGMGGIFG